MLRLRIRLLGPFQAEMDGELLLNFRSAKVRALLAYLAIETKKTFTREYLADLFWPDFPESKARSNLRNAIWNLRQEIGEYQPGIPFITSKNSKIQFNPQTEFWLDVRVFHDLIESACKESGQSPNAENIQKIEQALSLYQGQFLEDIFIDSPVFETWMDKNKLLIRQKRIQALRYISKAFYESGALLKALNEVKIWAELDPWEGEPCRLYMKILTRLGRRNEAIGQFRKYQKCLLEDLGVEPQQETNNLFEEIQKDQKGVNFLFGDESTAEFPIGRAESKSPPEFLIKSIEEQAESLNFCGREKELRQLKSWLEDALKGNGRVGMIVGEPGSGKTYLLNEFVNECLVSYPDLLVFQGLCNSHFGHGDLYYPFMNIVRMMANELTSLSPNSFVNLQHLERLWQHRPEMLYCLVGHGPDLIQRFLIDQHLIPPMKELPKLTPECKQVLYSPSKKLLYNHKEQIPVTDQFIQVLNCLANKCPILLIIDDLQWIDDSSTSLLFHLGRQISRRNVLLLGAFRPGEVFQQQDQNSQSLINVYQDFKTIFGEIAIDLDKSDGKAFIENLLSSEPNALSKNFHRKIYQLTSGNPLFTIELLRGMQTRNEIIHDKSGKWIEGDHLDWEQLPTKVDAAIARRISMLSKNCQYLLSIASIQGDIFDVNVIASMLGKPEDEIFRLLKENICKENQLITLHGIHFMGENYITTFRYRHELFQIYFYNQLTDVEKIRLHFLVGKVIEELYKNHIDQYPEIALSLARHFRLAGQNAKAEKYLILAGKSNLIKNL